MNRLSSQPFCYASIDDLRQALLIQIRRFNRACAEIAAEPRAAISLGPRSSSSLKDITITKKESGDLEKLKLLRDQVLLLQNMIGQLRTQFGTDPKAKALRDQVEDLHDDIAARSNALQDAISKDAHGKINSTVKRTTTALVQELIADLKLKSNQVAVQYFIAPIALPGSSETNVAAELAYVVLTNVNDPDGYHAAKMYVTLGFPRKYLSDSPDNRGAPIGDRTRPPRDKEGNPNMGRLVPRIYVSVNETFRIPSRIRWDNHGSKPADVRKIVHDQLTHFGINSAGVRRELPVPAEHIKFSHENIASTTVQGDMITVRVKDKNQIDQTEQDLLLQLKGIIHAVNKRNKDLIRTQVKRDAGIIRFVFTLPARLKGRLVSGNELNEIKRIFQLSDAEIFKIKTALEDHE